jgi:hypothetical protein
MYHNKRDKLVKSKKSRLSIENKLLIYKAVIKPIWSYGIELWGCVSKSNIVIMQRSRSKILRAIANAPRYITNHALHTDFNIPYVSDVIHERINKHHNQLKAHSNPLLEPLLQSVNIRRLKRCWPLDLQGTWGDIAGWIPYHVIIIITVAYRLYSFCLLINKENKKITIYTTVFGNMASCTSVEGCEHFGRICCLSHQGTSFHLPFNSYNEDSGLLRHSATYVPDYTVSNTRRPSESLPLLQTAVLG